MQTWHTGHACVSFFSCHGCSVLQEAKNKLQTERKPFPERIDPGRLTRTHVRDKLEIRNRTHVRNVTHDIEEAGR